MDNTHPSTIDGEHSLNATSTSTSILPSRSPSKNSEEKLKDSDEEQMFTSETAPTTIEEETTTFEKACDAQHQANYYSLSPSTKRPLRRRLKSLFSSGGKLQPFRLLKQDVTNIRKRYVSDWTLFNQLVFASAVFVFFTNILPGITFASDLYVLTGMTWGTIEVVFSTGLCGIMFSLSVVLSPIGMVTY
jgi:hypothetical protein